MKKSIIAFIKKSKLVVEVLFTIIAVTAGGIQLYKYIFKHEIVEGPIPLQEVNLILTEVQKLIKSNQFEKAKKVCYNLLDKKNINPMYKSEILLNLKILKQKGVKIKNIPQLNNPIPLNKLKGGKKIINLLENQRIKVVGTGAVPFNKRGPQGRLLAIRAAIVDGYRKIAEKIKGLKINERITLNDYINGQPEVATQVTAVIQGAKIIKKKFNKKEGIAEVEMVLEGKDLIRTLKLNNFIK